MSERKDDAERTDDRAVELAHAGKLGEARDLLTSLADDLDDDPVRQSRLFSRASELSLSVDGPERGERDARRALELAERSGDDVAMAFALTALARVQLRQHTDRALTEAEETLDRIPGEASLPPVLRATDDKLRGMIEARRGDVRAALDRFSRAYAGADGDPELRARVLLTWAVQLRNWGLFAEAQRRAERSLEIRLELGDHYGAAMCYGVLAFIYQRQGLYDRERDALVADLRACERIGGTADVPALHSRLAGALVGLGKYAGAWAEAETALELENRRLGISGADEQSGSRVHGYAWREQARVCLAQGRVADGLELVERAVAVFERVRDGYGAALCRLTEAELHADAVASGELDAADRARQALAVAQPVFVRLGAVPEAVETVLIECELDDIADRGSDAARRIVQQVLPMLQQAGLGSSELFRRAVETVNRLDADVGLDRVVTQAAMLRSLAAVVVETDPQPATVVGARLRGEAEALAFARDAVDRGAVVSWPSSDVGVAVFLGDRASERADALTDRLDGDCARADGEVDLEHMWPAGARARGAAVDTVVARLLGDG